MFFRRIPRKSWYEKAVERVFRDRRLCEEKLPPFGCVRGENGFLYRTKLLNGQLCMEFEIHAEGSVSVTVRDADGKSIPHLAQGEADRLRERALRREYEEELWHVAECCFEPDFFKGDPARSLVAHVREAYGDELGIPVEEVAGKRCRAAEGHGKMVCRFSGCAAVETGRQFQGKGGGAESAGPPWGARGPCGPSQPFSGLPHE